MAQPSFTPIAANWVVDPLFCAPNPVEFSIVRKFMTMTDDNLAITDFNGNILFKVKVIFSNGHDWRLLLDAAGNPILTLRRKLWSAHNRWEVFKGDSSDAKDLLFSTKRSSLFQFMTKLNVFLASNTIEEVCDFKVRGIWLDRTCVIYAGESSTIVAQIREKQVLLRKKMLTVTVYPNFDYVFVVALIVILHEMNSEDCDD